MFLRSLQTEFKGRPGLTRNTTVDQPAQPPKMSAQDIAGKLGIAKSTLYAYLRHRGVKIGAYRRPREADRFKAAS